MPKTSPTPRLYVPMLSTEKNEIRAFELSAIYLTHEGFELIGWDGMPWLLALPPGGPSFEDLPRFETSDACFDHIRETWPHLQP